jgi:hypothetical protein
VKVLVDECLPKPLIRALRGHNFRTVQEMGWGGLDNGKLLAKADDVFHVFLTSDQNLRYQQNLKSRLLSVVLLPTNHWPSLRNYISRVQRAVDTAKPGGYVEVSFANGDTI